jgi:hypothetical protein
MTMNFKIIGWVGLLMPLFCQAGTTNYKNTLVNTQTIQNDTLPRRFYCSVSGGFLLSRNGQVSLSQSPAGVSIRSIFMNGGIGEVLLSRRFKPHWSWFAGAGGGYAQYGIEATLPATWYPAITQEFIYYGLESSAPFALVSGGLKWSTKKRQSLFFDATVGAGLLQFLNVSTTPRPIVEPLAGGLSFNEPPTVGLTQFDIRKTPLPLVRAGITAYIRPLPRFIVSLGVHYFATFQQVAEGPFEISNTDNSIKATGTYQEAFDTFSPQLGIGWRF